MYNSDIKKQDNPRTLSDALIMRPYENTIEKEVVAEYKANQQKFEVVFCHARNLEIIQ